MKNILFLTALASVTGNLQAQSATGEADMQVFARSFMTAYNQQDHEALRKMYSEYAVRIDQKGNEMTGGAKIADYFGEQFKLNNATLLLRQTGLTWSEADRAWVASGTYEIYGKTIVYDINIEIRGTYANTMIKDKDQWIIAKSVLSPLVKVVVYHEVKDFGHWKSAFNEGLPALRAAGGLNCEIGTLQGDPNTAYVISEWPSVEVFQSFFSDPKLKASMGEAGVVGKPTVLILDPQ